MLYLVFKYFALCMAIVQVNREMHKYKRNDTQTNGWVRAGNRTNKTDP
jgi:hypothetical protein